jgi:large subunit ribosomal protein L29
MKQSVINELTLKDLQEKLVIEKAAYVKLKLGHSVSPVENPMKISAARKTVARLSTELRKRELSSSK